MSAIPIAIVSNGMPPYRLHLHRRIVRELPGVKLFSCLTHDDASGKWSLDDTKEIGWTHFGLGEPSTSQSKPGRALHEFRKGGRLIRFFRDEAVRAVILIGYNDPGRFRIIRWCRKHRVPCFVFGDSNIRGDRATGVRAVAKRIALRWLTSSVAGMMSCGTLGKQFFEKYGADPRRMWFFPYEPDYEQIRNLPATAIEQMRDRLQLNPARRRLLFVGRLARVKRADLLIDAFNAIAERRPDWDLLIIGDGTLRDELQARVRGGLADRVIWAGYMSKAAEIAAVMRCSDVLVLPSEQEPWGVVVNEAAAAGLALVCSDVVGAAAELLRDGVNGRSFPVCDLEALKTALLDVTDADHIARYRSQSPTVLHEWQIRGDPIAGLVQALRAVKVLH